MSESPNRSSSTTPQLPATDPSAEPRAEALATQAELWSFESSPGPADPGYQAYPDLAYAPPPHVSMPLGDYCVHPLPGLPGAPSQGLDVDPTVSPEHIACKQPARPQQAFFE